jgi:hypothetical protein
MEDLLHLSPLLWLIRPRVEHGTFFTAGRYQRCETVMICCSSGSGFGKVFGFGTGSGSGSGSRQYLAQLSKNKKISQILAFSMSEAAYFSKSWPLIFDFLKLF